MNIIFIIACLIASSAFGQSALALPVPEAEWTYIRIVNYDGYWGEPSLPASAPDLNVATSHVVPGAVPSVNAVYLLDGNDATGFSARAYVTPSTGRVVELIPELRMNETATYAEFFQWVARNFPAKKFVVSFWGHGGGSNFPNAVIGGDVTSYKADPSEIDGLGVREFGQVIHSLSTLLKKKVDLVFLCTCLNGTIENAYEIENSASYLVAGETSVGCLLEPFDTLAADTTQSPRDLAIQTVRDFQPAPMAFDVVYSAIDLSALESFVTQFKGVSEKLEKWVKKDSAHGQLALQWADQRVHMDDGSTRSTVFSTAVDLPELLDNIAQLPGVSPALISSARKADRALDAVILEHYWHPGDGAKSEARGLSIVHPNSTFPIFNAKYYQLSRFDQHTSWSAYVSLLPLK
jgi:hypothetical protein